MAEVGKEDPRWIVQERKDGQNVNNWHWQERPLDEKVHESLKKIFTNFPLTEGGAEANGIEDLKITEVSEVSGDCTVAQRKGKIMCYFEIKMTLKYTGKGKEDDEAVSGKVTIPDVDHDTFREDDYAMTVAATDRGTAQSKAEDFVRSKGRPLIRKAIAKYFEELFLEHNVGKNVKKPDGSPASPASPPGAAPAPAPAAAAAAAAPKPKPASPVASSSSDGTSFEQVMIWRVPPQELWTVITDAQRASAYTRSPAKIDPRPSGAFEFLGGAMSGYYVEMEHPKKITQQWRLSSWPSGVFSSVVISLSQEEVGVTRMEFAQVGIPAGELERCKSGWMCNFWEPIKGCFGFQYELK